MPELPEVETTRRGIAPAVEGGRVEALVVRQRRLRWPVPRALDRELPGARIATVGRRAKYLLFSTDRGTALLHLGMSGSLRLLDDPGPAGAHDHVDLLMACGTVLRFNDPRRFGALLWTRRDPGLHPLLRHLGPEPLGPAFDADYLAGRARGRRAPIKHLIMDSRIVVGIGNIYASEALFTAGIHPARAAGRVSRDRLGRLVEAIRAVLDDAIAQGGTTLRDFRGSDGAPGYFALSLRVYGRAGEPCPACRTPVRHRVLGQRATYYCPACQR